MSFQPGERALIALKEADKRVALFKKPGIPTVKKNKEKKIILTEDSYIEELGKIIQRDFFPDLAKLKAQNEYLEALNSNDVVKLRQIFSKYSSKRPVINESPATFETPATEPSSTPRHQQDIQDSVRSKATTSSTKSEKRSISDNHSVNSFFDKYTSEDNQSFEEIIDAADLKLKQKFAILYDAEDQQSKMLTSSLVLPSIENQFQSIERPNNVDLWSYRNKNYIMYIPDGVEFTQAEKIEMARRKMEINHGNTRLSSNPFDDKQNKATISDLAKTSKVSNNRVGFDGNSLDIESPQIRGFGFVKSPSPCPSIADSPLMTWGEIEGSPFRLDAGDTPLRTNMVGGPSFHIAATSKRENIALRLAEKVSEKHRAKKSKAIEAAKKSMCATPHIRSSLQRLASMSPAARRLSSAKYGIKDNFNTPSPRNHNKTPLVTSKTSLHKMTPSPLISRSAHSTSSKSAEHLSRASSSDSTLTDNLLDIPSKRPKASDFF